MEYANKKVISDCEMLRWIHKGGWVQVREEIFRSRQNINVEIIIWSYLFELK